MSLYSLSIANFTLKCFNLQWKCCERLTMAYAFILGVFHIERVKGPRVFSKGALAYPLNSDVSSGYFQRLCPIFLSFWTPKIW